MREPPCYSFSVLKLLFGVSFKWGNAQNPGDQSTGVASGGGRLGGSGSVGKEDNAGRLGSQRPGQRHCFEEAVDFKFI